MHDRSDDDIFARMEERSSELVDEAIRAIAAAARTTEGRRAAFEEWAIYKLAALQVLVELLGRQTSRSESESAVAGAEG